MLRDILDAMAVVLFIGMLLLWCALLRGTL